MRKTCLFLAFVFVLLTQTARTQNQAVETSGDILLYAMPTVALGSTLIIGDRKGTWQFAKGFVVNQAVTIGLKYAINKPRPYDNGDKAFPSGHTSTTFQSAAFIQRRYGWKFGIPAYTLAAFKGWSRINAHKHDGWDVLAGAIIGVGSSYILTKPYQRAHMELIFNSWDGNYVIGFNYKF